MSERILKASKYNVVKAQNCHTEFQKNVYCLGDDNYDAIINPSVTLIEI